jgi:hypothetical protein
MAKYVPQKIVCPKCLRYFANMDCRQWPNLSAKHISILAGNKKKLRDGDSLKCSLCSHEYTTQEITMAAAAPAGPLAGLKPGEKLRIGERDELRQV